MQIKLPYDHGHDGPLVCLYASDMNNISLYKLVFEVGGICFNN